MQIDLHDASSLAQIWEYGLLGASADGADAFARRAVRLVPGVSAALALTTVGERPWIVAAAGRAEARVREAAPFMTRLAEARRALVVPDVAIASASVSRTTVRPRAALRFLAGAPLFDERAAVVGALCLFDERPGAPLAPDTADALCALAKEAGDWLIRRRAERRGLVDIGVARAAA
ncbi:MAG: hypothetical protein RIB45_15620 [Marivibrio sp.]|uniref:hypothetical protein n=1 Tax=Marivibrio sp. TaxID=2039719 RepID=UPI0032EF473C